MTFPVLSGRKKPPTPLGAPTSPANLPTTGDRAVGRKGGRRRLSLSPPPATPHQPYHIVVQHGITHCPTCGLKVAVLVDDLCLECAGVGL